MPENKIDLRVVATIIGVLGAIAAAAGSWYVNDYRLTQLEKQNDKVMQQVADVKCLVAEVHQLKLPECR